MAVPAQYPSSDLPDYRNRMRQMLVSDNRVFFSPLAFNHNTVLDDFQVDPVAQQNRSSSALRMFNQLAGASDGPHQPSLNAVLVNESENVELACSLLGSRKRPREGDDTLTTTSHRQRQQQHQNLNLAPEYHEQQQTLGSGATTLPQTTGTVSTGLRLSFEDERLNSTISVSTSERADAFRSLLFAVREDLNPQLQQQREEIEQLFNLQGEQLRQLLEERRQRHARALIAAVEEGVSRRLREKDLEAEKMQRKNSELAEHMKQVSLEAHRWKNKAKNYEAMVTALRANLQQAQHAVVFTREQSKEGCGDSEADDAASSHHHHNSADILDDAQARILKENHELRERRTCRVCRSNDVSILLLPCRHLCLCKECESTLDACPLCRSLKNASVQVYMS